MAGISRNGDFPEKISPFLLSKMEIVSSSYGKDSEEYKALSLQYFKNPKEGSVSKEDNSRHWDADVKIVTNSGDDAILHGMERLYNKSIVVEPTMICSSHCRYCLRGNYDIFTLSDEQLLSIAKYCGDEGAKTGLQEILITGGDPLIVPQKLKYFIDNIAELAPNIRIIRIATRLLTHDPARIGDSFINLLKRHNKQIRFEVATQINHEIEFFPETIEVINKIRSVGVPIYSQNVILKGVNDNMHTMVNLYNKMRYYDVEAHYLFHCVPLKGMQHFRNSVNSSIKLVKAIANSGYLSGRAKPMFALMTDIGKITLYEDTIIGKEGDYLLLRSDYKYNDRLLWNPSWVLPKTASVDDSGNLVVKYLDGID